MDLGIAGKRALVTGSSSGIGAAIARMLAAEGCQVIVHGRNRERAEQVASGIGASAVAIGDLATDQGADLVADIAGGVDILVNNAGGSAGTSALAWTAVAETAWSATYELNVVAAARLVRRLLPAMQAKGWGRIINIASAAATQPIAMGPDYGAAKAAMLNMTVSLAKSLGPCGVTANSISPGMVMTPAVEAWLGSLRAAMGWGEISLDEAEKRAAREITPISVGRVGRPEEIAHVVCMIASPASGYMTGANIRVDGGQVQSVN